MRRVVVATLFLFLISLSAVAQTTIDTTTGDTSCQWFEFGVPDTATYGQTVTVPTTDTSLQSFSFIMRSVPTSLVFRAEVYAWDGTKATGPNLYESAPTSTTVGTGDETVTFNTGGINLTGGAQYVLFLTVSKDYSSSGTGAMAAACGGPYGGGSFVYFNNGGNFSVLTTNPWDCTNCEPDLAFRAVFNGSTATADLQVSKIAAGSFVAGQQSRYDITVTNSGPDTASNVVMTDVLPAGTTFVSIDAPAGFNCTTPAVGANGTVTCTATTLASGTNAQFVLTVAVDSGLTTGTAIANTATVTSDTTDPTPANNAATVTAAATAPVPTVSEWGLIAMMMAFAAFGALKLRA